jgi:hypothetical protein
VRPQRHRQSFENLLWAADRQPVAARPFDQPGQSFQRAAAYLLEIDDGPGKAVQRGRARHRLEHHWSPTDARTHGVDSHPFADRPQVPAPARRERGLYAFKEVIGRSQPATCRHNVTGLSINGHGGFNRQRHAGAIRSTPQFAEVGPHHSGYQCRAAVAPDRNGRRVYRIVTFWERQRIDFRQQHLDKRGKVQCSREGECSLVKDVEALCFGLLIVVSDDDGVQRIQILGNPVLR